MKNLSYFILGVAMIFLTSATTVSIMTVKPAKPTSVLVTYGKAYGLTTISKKYIKLGYQIKMFEGPSSYGECILVMEKY